MKKSIISLLIILLASTLGFSQFAFRLKGSIAFLNPDDYNRAADANNELMDLFSPINSGTFNKFCCAPNFGGELVYFFSDNIGIGVGAEYIRTKIENNLTYDVGTPTTQTDIFKVGVIPLILNFHFMLPVTSFLKASLSVGTAYYFSRLNLESSFAWDLGISGTGNQGYSFKSNPGALGFQGRIGIEIGLNENFFFTIGAEARSAKLKDIQGDWTMGGYYPDIGVFSGGGDDDYFWYYEQSFFGKTYPQTVFNNDVPAGVSNARKGIFDLSGLSFTAGVRIVFPSKQKTLSP